MSNQCESGLAKVAKGVLLGAAVAASVAFDCINNYTYGVSVNPLLADTMVIAAAGVVVLPWGRATGWIRAICLIMTVWAALNAYAASFGADILAKAASAEKHASAQADIDAARKTLSRITETADVSTLAQLDRAAQKAATDLEARDTKPRDTKRMGGKDQSYCFKTCRKARAEAMAIKARLAQAKARDKVRADLAAAQTRRDATPATEANPLASTIAAFTGGDANGLARIFALAVSVLGIAVTASIATLGHMATGLIGDGLAIMRKAKTARQKAILRDKAKASGGVIVGSNASLAAMLGVAVSTLGDARKGWLTQWQREGAIEIVSRERGKTVLAITNTAAKAA
ncbi:MAG: hypothetical protein P8Y36_09880 [Alphaproteobacteria bacterium]